MTETPTFAGSGLDARYGRAPKRSRRRRWIFGGAGGLLVVVVGVWVAWSGVGSLSAAIDSEDTGNHVINQHSVSISFDLSVKAGSSARCALQAQNEQHAIVGWEIVDIPPSNTFTRSFTHTVRTTESAFTGLIYQCWLT